LACPSQFRASPYYIGRKVAEIEKNRRIGNDPLRSPVHPACVDSVGEDTCPWGDCPDFCGRMPQKWDCPLPADHEHKIPYTLSAGACTTCPQRRTGRRERSSTLEGLGPLPGCGRPAPEADGGDVPQPSIPATDRGSLRSSPVPRPPPNLHRRWISL